MKLCKAGFEIVTPQSWEEMCKQIELIGRTCYKSEEKITEDSYKLFIQNLIKRGHGAMLEHATFSVKFIVDRGVSHELVRHRIASFAQESTRYCNYGKGGEVTFVIPNWFEYDLEVYKDVKYKRAEFALSTDERIWLNAMDRAESAYMDLLLKGWTPQQARSVLPNSTKTEIWITTNVREWRHFISLRADKPAHPQMREVVVPLTKELIRLCSTLFGDLEEYTL